jgi:putative tryptophan/tyrosine transport system substrate-binding protein
MRFDQLKRREFITVLSGAVSWPLAARAQQQPAMPVIGVLHIGLPRASPQLGYFRQGLGEAGYFEGQNIRIEYRSAEGQSDRLPELAADLVRRHVAVIAAVSGTNSALAAKVATTTIPIVFLTGGDPVKLGLVGSLNRPEGNITGITFLVEELGAKDIGLLHELLPDAKSVGFLVNPNNPAASQQIVNLQQTARTLGLDLQLARASNPSDLDEAFSTVADRKIGALLVGAGPLFGSNIDPIVALATRYRIPTVYYRREFVDAGGLMSYGTSASDAWHQVGKYIGRILKGAKPGDLPVMQSTKFEMVINLKTAKAIGIEVPPNLSARADEVIE